MTAAEGLCDVKEGRKEGRRDEGRWREAVQHTTQRGAGEGGGRLLCKKTGEGREREVCAARGALK